MWNTAHKHIQNLVAYEPGKPIEDLAREMGMDPASIIKMASNENALGPSPKAVAAMHAAIDNAHIYPDGGGWELRGAIAEKFGLARGNIVLGNGSNEIIEFVGHAFLKPGDEIVVSRYSFAVYPLMAQLFGVTTVEVPDKDFGHDLPAMLAAITPKTRIVFITNPNNPTGTFVTMEEIERFMAAVPDHVLVVFDEAYYEFVDNAPDTLRYVHEGRSVVVMRTFSKIQGLAGLRIGYAFAPEPLAELLQKTRQPFNANSIAQAAAVTAIGDDEHITRTRKITHEGIAFLQKEFERLGLAYVPSYANFVLVNVRDGDAVFRALLKQGVIVRPMKSYRLPEWVRVTVGTPEQNQRFLAALVDVMGL